MPVFARTKLIMYDVCFKEDPGDVELKYVGPNPQKLYQKVYEIMKNVWRAGDSDIQEENYSWTKGGDTEKFKVRWILHRDIDKSSFFWIRFDVSGDGNDKTGKASVTIRSVIITEYSQDTVWQRSLFYEMLRTFWYRIFYYHKREEFMVECRDLVAFSAKKIKEAFKELREEADQ